LLKDQLQQKGWKTLLYSKFSFAALQAKVVNEPINTLRHQHRRSVPAGGEIYFETLTMPFQVHASSTRKPMLHFVFFP